MQDAIDERRNGEDKTHKRARRANIKERAVRAHRRTNQNKRAKGAGEVGEGNKERIAGPEVMVSASEEVPQFMGKQNPEQGSGKRES